MSGDEGGGVTYATATLADEMNTLDTPVADNKLAAW